ncbi:MAG: phosphoribosylformylglycinamidine synthase [Verrucomicrobiales bacterium]|nr:phosphoribosylformylglycinamidine synthase [Verrucomicrobiales bacterium]
MAEAPKATLINFPGTNADHETERALKIVGFETEMLPISLLTEDSLDGVSLVVFSGGFSYGDYVMSGRIAKLVTQNKIGDTLRKFRDGGGYLLGICNGFQILTQLDLLPPCSLVHNTSGRFQCQWVTLKNHAADASPFLAQLPDEFEFPIAHAEGRLVTADPADAEKLIADGFAALTYTTDVNGSFQQIAGLKDESGRVLGLMPHPERFMFREDHYDPDWGDAENGSGHYLFQSLFENVSASR